MPPEVSFEFIQGYPNQRLLFEIPGVAWIPNMYYPVSIKTG